MKIDKAVVEHVAHLARLRLMGLASPPPAAKPPEPPPQ